MVNNITADQYAKLVAWYCNDIISLSRLYTMDTYWMPITQFVAARAENCWHRDEPTENVALLAQTIHFSMIHPKEGNHRDIECCLDVKVDIGQTVYDAVHNAIRQDASIIDSPEMKSIYEEVESHPSLMFFTTIYQFPYESNPDKIRQAYIDNMTRKFRMAIPKELVVVVDDIRARTDLSPTIGFASVLESFPNPDWLLKRKQR